MAKLVAQGRDIMRELNPRDISTIAWALGTMRCKVDPAFWRELSDAALSAWDNMQPQVMLHDHTLLLCLIHLHTPMRSLLTHAHLLNCA